MRDRFVHIVELTTYLHWHHSEILRELESIIQRSGIARSRWLVRREAEEVYSDLMVAAQARSDEFDPNDQPDIWLKLVAMPILEERTRVANLLRPLAIRQRLIDANPARTDILDDGDAFEALLNSETKPSKEFPESAKLLHHEFMKLLMRLPVKDRKILKLAITHRLDSDALGEHLGCLPGMARLRFHDAFSRLRQVWNTR